MEEDKNFKDLGICEQLAEACDNLGWKIPTKIQAEAIPHALEGKDLIGLAQTGSGKTGAFALPILQSLLESPQAFFACVLSPTRDVHNPELEAFSSFIKTIYSTLVRGIKENKRCWLPCKSKGFTKIPSRVAFFVWTAILGNCLTTDNLRKRKFCILDWCYMCKCNSETVDHLFLHSPVALELWDMVFGLFGVYWVMPMSVVGLFACWQGRFGRHRNGDIWMVVSHCLMWCIWKDKNSGCFEDNECSMPDLKFLFFRTLLDWELAIQIAEHFEALGACIGVKCAVLVGGIDRVQQTNNLANRPHIIVGTPGRLVDHLSNTKGFSLRTLKYLGVEDRFKWECPMLFGSNDDSLINSLWEELRREAKMGHGLVLDEADRLLNEDFEKPINEILNVIPRERRTYLFSATMTSKVKKLQRACLRNPVKIEAASKYSTVDTLKQQFCLLPAKYKECYLVYILTEMSGCTSMVFTRTCDATLFLAMMLRHLGLRAIPINGKMTQSKRSGALNQFKAGECNILICTDVASRGLDIELVDMVINYDIPTSYKLYNHRVGRTARAGRSGVAVSLVNQYEWEWFVQIENDIGKKISQFPCQKEEVLLFMERVTEAQRIARVKERKSSDPKSNPYPPASNPATTHTLDPRPMPGKFSHHSNKISSIVCGAQSSQAMVRLNELGERKRGKFVWACTVVYGPTIDGLEFANIEEDGRLSLEMDFSKEVAAKKTKEGGLLQGFHVGPINTTGIRISHLLFADDAILFCDASREQLLSIRLALTCFQAFTGLKVNVGQNRYLEAYFGENGEEAFGLKASLFVIGRLERIQRSFLWGSSEECFKYPLVAWEKVCLPLELGGLGSRKLVSFNQALLGKWLWSYLCLAIKEGCIFDVLSPSVGGNDRVWNLRFYREFNDWELASSFSFFHLIQSRIPRGGGCDSLCWSFNGSGKFDTEIRDVTPIFPWKGICKVKRMKDLGGRKEKQGGDDGEEAMDRYLKLRNGKSSKKMRK
uniref:Uncharacterized protein n=1 Tax=Quercus lobata TaxID=97700 RepID=A0A7N2RC83_QUELO